MIPVPLITQNSKLQERAPMAGRLSAKTICKEYEVPAVRVEEKLVTIVMIVCIFGLMLFTTVLLMVKGLGDARLAVFRLLHDVEVQVLPRRVHVYGVIDVEKSGNTIIRYDEVSIGLSSLKEKISLAGDDQVLGEAVIGAVGTICKQQIASNAIITIFIILALCLRLGRPMFIMGYYYESQSYNPLSFIIYTEYRPFQAAYYNLIYFQLMPKRTAKQQNSDEEEQVEDIMAWGNRRENYYQQSQDEYSSLEQEEQEAKRIYQNQLNELADEEVYQLPQQQDQDEDSETDQQNQTKQLSAKYLNKEIKKMTSLGMEISQIEDSQIKNLLDSHIQAYLMSLIALKELKIEFLEFHPLLNQVAQIKQDIENLKSLLYSSSGNDEGEEQEEQIDEEEEAENEDQQEIYPQEQAEEEESDEVQAGLKLYEQAKKQHDAIKKQKKDEKKIQRQKNKKPAFSAIKQNQGRLANEKILKNKGLIKKRKKIDRNSRVKHRMRFQKANSKRRAHGHFIRENPGRQYQGETNIKYGRIASTKIK